MAQLNDAVIIRMPVRDGLRRLASVDCFATAAVPSGSHQGPAAHGPLPRLVETLGPGRRLGRISPPPRAWSPRRLAALN